MEEYQNNIQKLITDASNIIGKPILKEQYEIVDRGCPHKHPTTLPKNKMAIYMFFYEHECLKIGKAFSKSQARFTTQHYGFNSKSTLAKSICDDDSIHILKDNVSNWMHENLRRIDILIDERLGVFALELIEGLLHYYYEPRYEGYKMQRNNLNEKNGGAYMSNFESFLPDYEVLYEYGETCEQLIYIDTQSAVVKCRTLIEAIVKQICESEQIDIDGLSLLEILEELKIKKVMGNTVLNTFHNIRIWGNKAAHITPVKVTLETAMNILRQTYFVSIWFLKIYVNKDIEAKGFIEPKDKKEDTLLLKQKIELLEDEITQIKGQKLNIDNKIKSLAQNEFDKSEFVRKNITADIRWYISDKISESQGAYIDIKAGDVQKEFGLKNRTPMFCNAMRQLMKQGDKIIFEPPSGFSTTLTIRYYK